MAVVLVDAAAEVVAPAGVSRTSDWILKVAKWEMIALRQSDIAMNFPALQSIQDPQNKGQSI